MIGGIPVIENPLVPLIDSKGEKVIAWRIPKLPPFGCVIGVDAGKSLPVDAGFEIHVHPDRMEEFIIRATQPGLWELIEDYEPESE